MYMTQREQEMELAQKDGYNKYPFGEMPQVYKGLDYLAKAWRAGFEQARQENNYF